MTASLMVRLIAAVLTVVVAAGCTVHTVGSPVPAGGSGGEPGSDRRGEIPTLPGNPGTPGNKSGEQRAPDDYQPPDDGTGFATQPYDQPAPVPGYNWAGWGTRSRCDWLPPDLMAPLATGPANQAGHFCTVPVAGGDKLQIMWGGMFNAITEPTTFVRALTVAGLEARAYDFPRNTEQYPDSCHIAVHTRSLSYFSVLNWNPEAKPANRDARCQVAIQAAELIARRLVPPAGGTVWPQTPKQPSPESVAGRDACEIVSDLQTGFGGVIGKGTKERTDLGETCTYEQRGRRIVALVTEGPDQGLAQVSPPDGAKATPRKLGTFEARQEIVDEACAVATEFLPGRLLRVEYRDDYGTGAACKIAEVVIGQAVQAMLERS